MKNKNTYLKVFITAISIVLLTGCYSDTIDSFKTFTFQFPLLFQAKFFNKQIPDTSFDFANLNKYQEYKDNLAKISSATIYQFNYRIDSLIYKIPGDSTLYVFDKSKDAGKFEFEYIRYFLIFAKKKAVPVNGDEMDSSNYEIDPARGTHMIGEFRNVKVEEYFRTSHHIETIEDSVSKVIDEAVRTTPMFYIQTEYSKLRNAKDGELRYFPFISARYDMIIRFSVSI